MNADTQMEVTIRTVKIEDYTFIYQLNKCGLGYDYHENKTKQRLIRVLKDENTRIFVAEIWQQIVGYIHATDYDCTYVDSLKDILALSVDENFRGKGIGRMLLSAVENWAKETDATGVRLVSGIDREAAHTFYEACGYINRKNQKNFIKIFDTAQ